MLERSYKTQLQLNPEGQRPHPPRTLNGGTQTRLAMPPEDGQPARRPRLLGGRRGRTTLAATVGRGLDDEAPARTGHDMGAGAEEAFSKFITKRMDMPFFANARTVRNAIDLARMRAAVRIFNEKMDQGSDGMVTEDELMTITGDDFPTPAELDAEGENAIVA